jgi:hypothetical protein
VIARPAWNEYLRCTSDPAAIHAMCEDYRAGASIDLEHDRRDLERKIGCPPLLLWGEQISLRPLPAQDAPDSTSNSAHSGSCTNTRSLCCGDGTAAPLANGP